VPLTIYDPSPKVLSSALTKLESLLSRDVSKNRISQSDSDQARERVTGVNGDGTTGEVIEGVDLVIEVSSPISTCIPGLIGRLSQRYLISRLACFND
jgi:3-hydroxybutyryl-CoA dehydrogenase